MGSTPALPISATGSVDCASKRARKSAVPGRAIVPLDRATTQERAEGKR